MPCEECHAKTVTDSTVTCNTCRRRREKNIKIDDVFYYRDRIAKYNRY